MHTGGGIGRLAESAAAPLPHDLSRTTRRGDQAHLETGPRMRRAGQSLTAGNGQNTAWRGPSPTPPPSWFLMIDADAISDYT